MQGYTWSSNQLPPPNYQEHAPAQYQEHAPPQYQERAPPQYQERAPPQYQEHAPGQYQERAPAQYQERAPPQYQGHAPTQYQQYSFRYQDKFLPKYQDVRNDQPNKFQAKFNTQLYTTTQTGYSNGQQDAASQCKSKNIRLNLHGYNTQTNRAHPQYPCAASNTQQHYLSENPNTYRNYAQFFKQSNPSTPQNYRNTGHNQAHLYWSPQSDHGSSVANRGWSTHISNNGSSCSMNNQQQLQPPRTAPRHHQQHQFSRQHSGKHHNMHHQTKGHRQQSSSWAQYSGVSSRISNSQAQSRPAASYTSCNSATTPSGAQGDISLPSNNLNQSPVNQNQPELRSNAGPDVLAIRSQNNQSTAQQSQGTNSETYNVKETFQTTRTNEAQPHPHTRSYVDTLIYRILCSKGNAQANKQQSDEGIAHQNTCSEQSEVCATNRTDHPSKQPSSEPSAQCAVEPPSKRMNNAVLQRDYWSKETTVPKDFGVQSVRPGTHQMGSNENRPNGTSQHNMQYSTDPADCLEAVFALQKVSQQVLKAIAIVPPISQQALNTVSMADTSPQKADSPPLKIDSVWTLVDESDAQKTVNDKLPESPSPTVQQEDKSLEIETTSNFADSDICSTSTVECQNNALQGDRDSSDASFDLSSVPVVKYTLEKLMDLVKSLEVAELSSGFEEESESFFNKLLKLYWNGSQDNLVEALKSFRKEARQHSSVDIVWDYETVVFESIETENLKKLAHCEILNNEIYSSSEEFRCSWLNVDGRPAYFEEVLSEPLLDDITVIKATFSDKTVVTSNNLCVNSPKDVPENDNDKSEKPDTCTPTALLTPQSGNDREEMASENNGHSYAGLSRMTDLSSDSCEKEIFKKQEDIKQNPNFNTQPSYNSPLAKRSTEKLTDSSNEIEGFRQDHSEHKHHIVSVPDSLPVSPGNSDLSFSTKTLCNSKDTWQIEDISDDENPNYKEALNNSSDVGLVEDISEDENTGNKEVLPSSSDTWPIEDISEDENAGNEVLPKSSDSWPIEDISEDENTGNKEVLPSSSDTWPIEDISEDENAGNKEVLPSSSDTWDVEDISDDETPSNKDTCGNSSICVVEDVSNDENSSESMLMEITVLSSEDAKTFFQQLETDPECGIKTTISKSDCPDLVACFDAPSEPNCDYNKADTCSLCGTKIATSNSTKATDSDGDLFCFQCWEQAPLLELEEEPCPPVKNEVNVLFVKSNKQHQDCSPPCLKLKVEERDVASTNECIVYERPTQLVQNSPSFEPKVKELNVASPETCAVNEGLTGQKRDGMVKSEPGENCCPPCLDFQVKEPTVVSLEDCIGNERLTGQKCEPMVKSELEQSEQTCSPPSFDLKVKELTVTSIKKCIADEKRDCMEKSELGKNCSLSLELKVGKPTVASIKELIGDGLTGQKSQSVLKSCSPPSLELQVKVPNVYSPDECTKNSKMLTGQKVDCMIKSKLGQNCSQPSLELEVNDPIVASTEERSEDERLTGQKSERFLKSKLRQNCSPPSLEPSSLECVADEGLTGQKSDGMGKSVTKKVPEIQRAAERELTKIQPNKPKNDKMKKNRLAKPQPLFKCNKPPPKKSAFKHKLKSVSTSRTGSDDPVLFAPDIVVKKKLPLKKNLKRPCGESQDGSKTKRLKKHGQERQDYPDRTSQNHRGNPQKVTEKVPGHSKDTPPHESKKKLELHGILSVNKTKSTEPKKVRFDLYGSSREKQIYAHERRFSAPATLMVSDACKDYTDELSAKQKVLNQWSSTFIPKTKSFGPRSPQKKKTPKAQDLLKSNINALKSHLTHRAMLQSSSEKDTNDFRKPVFHQKLTKTLSR